MVANSCAHSLSHSPWEYPAFLTCHACISPSGTWPPNGSFLSQCISSGGAYCRVRTPHAQILRESSLFLLVLGVWFENHLSFSFTTIWDVEARGPHAPTMPPPSVPPPPRLSLPVGITRGHFHSLSKRPKRLYHAEAGQRPRLWTLKKTPTCPAVLSNGFLSRGPTMLTLVNAWGPYGTVSLFLSLLLSLLSKIFISSLISLMIRVCH